MTLGGNGDNTAGRPGGPGIVAPSSSPIPVPPSDAAADEDAAALSSSTPSLSTTNHPSHNPHNINPIRVLPSRVVQLIAAGEVVQRPASAVKELLENSIDANSTHISVRVEFSNSSGSTGGGGTATKHHGGGGANNTALRLSRLSVSDDGCGMSLPDMGLAATRHATSKLQTTDDLQCLTTLGFRGEALSSMSCVSLLTVTSRTHTADVAYRQSYQDGHPTTAEPNMCARTPGTTVTMEDLFHNLPSRQASLLQSSEYARIISVVQQYAIHCAAQGISVSCEKVTHKTGTSGTTTTTTTNSVDINTSCLASIRNLRHQGRANHETTESSSLASISADGEQQEQQQQKQWKATQEAIGHLYGHRNNVSPFAAQLIPDSSNDNKQRDDNDTTTNASPLSSSTADPFLYRCTGCVTTAAPSSSSSSTTSSTSGSAKGSKRASGGAQNMAAANRHNRKGGGSAGQLVLFVNHRLVECGPLKKTVEAAYLACGVLGPWFAYLHVQVPPHNVDVNVHPSKQHVTMLHLDRISAHLRQSLHELLAQHQNGPTFRLNPVPTATGNRTSVDKDKKRKAEMSSSAAKDGDGDVDEDEEQEDGASAAVPPPPSKKMSKSSTIAPSKVVRTNRNCQAGALEPFLLSMTAPTQLTARKSISSTSSTQSSSTGTTSTRDSPQSSARPPGDSTTGEPSNEAQSDELVHDDHCPLANSTSLSTSVAVDMSQPGAFAQLASMCQCRGRRQDPSLLDAGRAVTLARQAWVKPKKVVPTDCSYTSIVQLRKRVHKTCHPEWHKKLRKAVFVGVVSRHRSLIQCDEQLVEIHHGELASALFYQLALCQFAGANVARLVHPLDVEVLVGSAAQFEEDLGGMGEELDAEKDAEAASATAASASGSLNVSETNQRMASQVAQCLLQHAELLAEYFSILIEERDGTVLLVGLPVLLEGYSPPPHGIPNFLLRLATEVDWTDEKPCFHGVCRELGTYYALLDTDPTIYQQVRHLLFPAVSSLLMPTADLVKENSSPSIRVLTSLSKLYKVFERC